MEGEDPGAIVIPIDSTYSDGDRAGWPTGDRFDMPDDSYYRRKIARLWAQKVGFYEPGRFVLQCLCYADINTGKEYILDTLPDGYAIFDRPRGTDPDIVSCTTVTLLTVTKPQRDRFLYGHPLQQYFYSTVQFFPHFCHLMSRGKEPCTCLLCEKLAKRKKAAVIKLRAKGQLDEKITEPVSMDWRAERTPLREYLEKLNMLPSFVPRTGELVLWTTEYEGKLAWNPEAGQVQIYRHKEWHGAPEWRAGVVGQLPEEDVVLQDIVATTPKKWGPNYSGFRVETFPDPNSEDKSYSLQHKYVPMKCIRPFGAYEHFLQGVPREKLHPSIENALTVMASFSLLEKYRFQGTWPDAAIYCRGIFLGAEFLAVGDAVRLKPSGCDADTVGPATAVTPNMMIIHEIRLELKECDADPRSKQLAETYQVRIQGKVYTNDRERAAALLQRSPNSPQPPPPPKPLTSDEIASTFHYVGMSGYGEWYPLHSGALVNVSQDMILGRCYEPDAMQLLFRSPALHYDLHGVLRGRAYSRATDERIRPGKRWFWGDFRTQTLALDTLNGEDVGHYSDVRDVKMWRANLRVIDGTARAADFRDAKIPGDVGRPSTKTASNFAKVGKLSKLVSTGLGAVDGSAPASSAEDGDGDGDGDGAVSGGERESEEEEYTLRIDQLRGGTEETEGGDYVPGPGTTEQEPQNKRARMMENDVV
ncbi:hypothetical protein ASPACDRAFT_26770 [Aspergillus aculeatus ATCC 16872]|uniref:Cryptic loci regulator 2 C-terminal domain-containing protein n=1 Tax=Aspergillus aculeatus (strain ATCC 16872 / CBS 172.66 / WB 5094) TaxID=690307 RepID=A0A1L9WY42_ASPA1|nr:uncharacterized protein ASPACDRAFT_26770 [Aspergillus aculeatus ATCC 16872]OJK00986.1 hypothetical protein ASPACDRAFT_26770 [Aspergillus aculeatus ATCC 16872]